MKPLFHRRTSSQAKNDSLDSPQSPEQRSRAQSDAARAQWKRAAFIARRAGHDDTDSESSSHSSLTEEQLAERRERKMVAKKERERTAKMMDLQYFLEMVDTKHRYGSNLRAYHNEWKKVDTNENFFYWLDEGDGKNIEVPTVTRERLDKERVRYLSREERQKYLVKIDKEGRLCWAKNGMRISTNLEWKDSLEDGIVPATEEDLQRFHHKRSSSLSSSSSSSSESDRHSVASDEAAHYVNHDLDRAKGLKKIKHVSASAILNELLQRTVRPNSWIFVADTSFRLYVGIKQSGSFQHSSFLHGSRISAAGLIKIKNGQLRRLSPLSGHYRPPTANFRAFVHSLRDNGVDMSRVSISRSYAILVGLETYVRTRKKFKKGIEKLEEETEKVVHPDEARKRAEAKEDKSESARKEREILAREEQKEEQEKRERREKTPIMKFWRRISVSFKGTASPSAVAEEEQARKTKEAKHAAKDKKKKTLSTPHRDVESGIPPDGRR
jgi:hypothetical protein